MKKASSLLIVALTLTFMGCSKGESEKGQNTTNVTPASTAPAASAALNPPHGQPGHRCDIEVGAPLTTPALPQPNLQMPAIGSPAPAGGATAAPAGGTTVAGTNPPHGEPGHDCAVPVGAPLNK
ncbi:MAG: hypothetical protein KY428_05555 [Bacteroidetes bacterium]|nr:hypothetical protein [Bacteroidota bacterium]